eukprot:4064472-Prymnesium_polylepis.1
MLDEKPPRVHARRGAAVPRRGGVAQTRRETFDGTRNARTLLGLWQSDVILPSPAVATHVEIAVRQPLAHRRGDFGQSLERERAGEGRRGHTALLKCAQYPVDADARAVLEHRLGRQVAHSNRRVAGALAQCCCGRRVAIRHIRLGALLEIYREVDRDFGASWPARGRRLRPVTSEITPRCGRARDPLAKNGAAAQRNDGRGECGGGDAQSEV